MRRNIGIGTILWINDGHLGWRSGIVTAMNNQSYIVKRAGKQFTRPVRVRKSDGHMPAHNGIGEGYWMTTSKMNKIRRIVSGKPAVEVVSESEKRLKIMFIEGFGCVFKRGPLVSEEMWNATADVKPNYRHRLVHMLDIIANYGMDAPKRRKRDGR